jgi:hypothetical protein
MRPATTAASNVRPAATAATAVTTTRLSDRNRDRDCKERNHGDGCDPSDR